MKIIKSLFLGLFFQSMLFPALAQQQPSLYTQYMFNGLAINPAYAGSQGALSATALMRKQWINIDGAPTTSTFSLHTPIKNEKIGVGIQFNNDQISVFNQTSLSGVYAYRIRFSEHKILSLGLQAGFSNYTARYSQLTSYVANDPALGNGDYNSFIPAFGAGIYYYTKKMYAGLSVPYIASSFLKSKRVVNNLNLYNYYFFTAGYIFNVSHDVKIKPNILIRYQQNSVLQADFNMNVLFKEAFWIGASYRSFNALSFMTQLNITDQFRVGYAYDINIGKTASLNTGTHEIVINYLFVFSKTKVINPRYF